MKELVYSSTNGCLVEQGLFCQHPTPATFDVYICWRPVSHRFQRPLSDFLVVHLPATSSVLLINLLCQNRLQCFVARTCLRNHLNETYPLFPRTAISDPLGSLTALKTHLAYPHSRPRFLPTGILYIWVHSQKGIHSLFACGTSCKPYPHLLHKNLRLVDLQWQE